MRTSAFIMAASLAWLRAFASPSQERPTVTDHFLGIEKLAPFERTEGANGVTLTSPWYSAPMAWNELLVSWNASCATNAWVVVRVRAASQDATTGFYEMGRWTTGDASGKRTSVRRQKDEWARVETDTLICNKSMTRAQVRLELGGVAALPTVTFLGICFSDTRAPRAPLPPHRKAWGMIIEAPQRSQLGHADASGWCSPTAVSMMLAHWAGVLKRPELDIPVPEVARGVHDPAWEGTGNWAFNMAYAGQFPGMRAYVTRVAGVQVLEKLVETGIPVAASVSFDLLNGKPTDDGNGHLIVVVGFTVSGDVVANDPWPNPKGENSVRRVFPRERFQRAWQRSHQAVYLIHPSGSTSRALALIN